MAPYHKNEVSSTNATMPLTEFGPMPSNNLQYVIAESPHLSVNFYGYSDQHQSIYEFMSLVGGDPAAKHHFIDPITGEIDEDRTCGLPWEERVIIDDRDVRGLVRIYAQLKRYGINVPNTDGARLAIASQRQGTTLYSDAISNKGVKSKIEAQVSRMIAAIGSLVGIHIYNGQ